MSKESEDGFEAMQRLADALGIPLLRSGHVEEDLKAYRQARVDAAKLLELEGFAVREDDPR